MDKFFQVSDHKYNHIQSLGDELWVFSIIEVNHRHIVNIPFTITFKVIQVNR